MKTLNKSLGLREQLARAETHTELGTLLHTGLEFKYASPHTRRRWINTANKRRIELDARKQRDAVAAVFSAP